MDLEKIRQQVDLLDSKAVELRRGLDRLISGVIADVDAIELTQEQKAELRSECLGIYNEIKECIVEIDEELSE